MVPNYRAGLRWLLWQKLRITHNVLLQIAFALAFFFYIGEGILQHKPCKRSRLNMLKYGWWGCSQIYWFEIQDCVWSPSGCCPLNDIFLLIGNWEQRLLHWVVGVFAKEVKFQIAVSRCRIKSTKNRIDNAIFVLHVVREYHQLG